MHYLGGKCVLAVPLVAAMRAEQGDRQVWEPFCGGLAMTAEFAKRSRGLASDAHAPLIGLYRAMRAGWTPPRSVDEQGYARARLLPDADPLKAFIGFGCSFSGKWFGGYARGDDGRDYADMARRSLARKLVATRAWTITCASFFDVTPRRMTSFLYCDPPYAGTAGYGMDFDHDHFWRRCQEWARYVPVYVSEFDCPVPARVVHGVLRNRAVSATTGVAVDVLYRVLPRQLTAAAQPKRLAGLVRATPQPLPR